MNEASFASLSPTLLARKGGAKPAMRPQLGPIPNPSSENLEDLGWNDMGEDSQTADVVQLKPATTNDGNSARPAVHQEREELEVAIAQDNEKAAAPRKKAAAKKEGKRAAFTLRLDSDRHLKLRLASTMEGKSAQQLVTEALDALLDNFDDLDTLAARMKRS